MNNDRTVHAETGYAEVVRYERAGKWYVEDKVHVSTPLNWRTQMTLAEIIELVRNQPYGEADIYLGRPGGKRFDLAIRRWVSPGGFEARS